jgi:DNA polymerase I-like protein with 3'-5' exonuclease and polymerase domains
MLSAYGSGDPYLSFAVYAGAVPPGATKEQYPRERALFKTTILGTQYLIGANGLGYKLGITLQEAEDLLEHHHRIFPRFWLWSDAVSDYGQLHGELTAAFGWRMRVSPATSLRTLRNFPMQANGAEMLRLGCILTADAGIPVLAPIHDAVLIEASEPEIEHAVSVTKSAMQKASEMVLAGFPLRTEARIIRPPNRLLEERGIATWNWMLESLKPV